MQRRERLIAKGGCRLDEALIRRPGAFPGATALEQARLAAKFTLVYDACWAAAVKAHGDTACTTAVIEALLLARHVSHEHLVAGLANVSARAAARPSFPQHQAAALGDALRPSRAREPFELDPEPAWGEDEPEAQPLNSWIHGMLAGITLVIAQHHQRSLGIRHEGQPSTAQTNCSAVSQAAACRLVEAQRRHARCSAWS
ncbi:hypothetical protein [Streptomyces sp. NPDC007074]|uniref:hypothetical protein n=1 Tax=Streptomyces sp. NPDC007074 TaxID=3156764 RepID=UPI0033EDD4C4